MAYFSQANKKEMAPKIKAVMKRYGMAGSLSVRHYSTVVLTIKSGPIDFGCTEGSVNVHWIEEHFKHNPTAMQFLKDVYAVLMGGNHNNSDAMTDYFDVGWYVNINIGSWKKHYSVVRS